MDITNSSTEVGAYTFRQIRRTTEICLVPRRPAYADERSTMKEIAEQTGGEAFLGTNDLRRAMQRSIDDGATYYTLAYTPDKIDPRPHSIASRSRSIIPTSASPIAGAIIRRRKNPAPSETGVAALRGALQPGMPQSTMLFLTASVLPPDVAHKDVRIQYVDQSQRCHVF